MHKIISIICSAKCKINPYFLQKCYHAPHRGFWHSYTEEARGPRKYKSEKIKAEAANLLLFISDQLFKFVFS